MFPSTMHSTTPEERRKLGAARRKQVARQDHAELKPKARRFSAWELLHDASKGRVPALLKRKWQLMAESPFGYFRGAVPVIAADLAVLPNTGILTQICGDAHVRNLGAYEAAEGSLVFDINDFDETIRAPFEWDLKRMAASLVLAGRESGHKDRSSREAVLTCVTHYATLMRTFAQMPSIEVSRFQVHRIGSIEPVHRALAKAERVTPLRVLERLTEPVPDQPHPPRRFRQNPPQLTRLSHRVATEVLSAQHAYCEVLEPQRRHLLSLYRVVDLAFKVVGTGSVGLRDYCIYFEGNGVGDPLFLQLKEESASAYGPYLPDSGAPQHNGRRVVEGHRAMQLQSDPFLGWTRIAGRDYFVRQLNDHKAAIEIDDLAGSGLAAFGEVCGELLARGHARAGDPLVLAGYLGSGSGFAEALADFGVAYADQTEKDWHDLRRTLKAGRVKTPSKMAAGTRPSRGGS